MKKVNVFLVMCGIVLCAACVSKQPPSPMGESVSVEQIKNLPKNDSWNNKLVSFEGYFGFCSRVAMYKAGTKAKLRITTAGNCEGEYFMDAKILMNMSGETPIAGAAPRNQIIIDKNIDLETLKVITDDYQKVNYQKFIFSGNLIYDNGYYLDNVTIHLIK